MKFHPNYRTRFAVRYIAVFLLAILTTPIYLFSQNAQTIRGVITSGQTNAPLPDVSVTVKGTFKGTTTGANGEYSITATSADILVFSYSGFTTHEEKIGGRTTINFTLEVSNSKLDEVVVVGYGTSKRKDLTGAVSSISGTELA